MAKNVRIFIVIFLGLIGMNFLNWVVCNNLELRVTEDCNLLGFVFSCFASFVIALMVGGCEISKRVINDKVSFENFLYASGYPLVLAAAFILFIGNGWSQGMIISPILFYALGVFAMPLCCQLTQDGAPPYEDKYYRK